MLAPLADADDLAARGVDVSNDDAVLAALDSASAAVRDAAGCAITRLTSTVTLTATDWRHLTLPAGPVASVASVTVDGDLVSGWLLRGDVLVLPWGTLRCVPATVVVVYTHGLLETPADIVDLVCGMAGMSIGQTTSGAYGSTGLLSSVRLGDYSESYSSPAGTESASPVALPDAVRQRLRERFGAAVSVVGICR